MVLQLYVMGELFSFARLNDFCNISTVFADQTNVEVRRITPQACTVHTTHAGVHPANVVGWHNIRLPNRDFCVQFWIFDCERMWCKLQTFQANLWESHAILQTLFELSNPEFDLWIIRVLKCWLDFPQKQKKQGVHCRSAVGKKLGRHTEKKNGSKWCQRCWGWTENRDLLLTRGTG